MKEALKILGMCFIVAVFAVGLYYTVWMYGQFNFRAGFFQGYSGGTSSCGTSAYGVEERMETWQITES